MASIKKNTARKVHKQKGENSYVTCEFFNNKAIFIKIRGIIKKGYNKIRRHIGGEQYDI